MSEWTLFEVFVRSKHGLNHKHVGSVHAADTTMAIENARELYTRIPMHFHQSATKFPNAVLDAWC